MEGQTVKAALAKNVIIDTAGFIKNPPLQEFGQNLITMHEVIDEIRDKETKLRLKALPFELQFMEPDCESIQKITNFSKKTGDYGSLSATDIKVMALTYMLEVRNNGKDHLNEEPTVKKTVEFYKPGQNGPDNKALVGFYSPESDGEEELKDEGIESEDTQEDSSAQNSAQDEGTNEVTNEDTNEGTNEDTNEGTNEGTNEDTDESDDDEGWITPSNLKAKKKEMLGLHEDLEDSEPKELVVACLTNDFAMQNVLKQIGLHVLSTDGVIIKETKTWILRCYACFATTPKMDLKFCPKCGNTTLKRVSVTVNKDGSQQIHISTRRPLSTKGKKFSLPTQKGGKYAINPILTADQRIPQQRRTAMAYQKTNAMGEDYIAGNGPFQLNDVNSKSAMLGFGMADNHYWAHRNPNAVGRKTGNRKKKNRH